MLKHIPNALTLTRLILAPVIAWLFWQALVGLPVQPGAMDQVTIVRAVADDFTMAAILFIVAALTDLFDGMAARAFNAHSKFGRLIDPIADKILVGLPLAVLLAAALIILTPYTATIAICSAVIILRDVTMTAIRLRSTDGEGARVSSLAKWKTALELVVVGSYLVVRAIYAHIDLQRLTGQSRGDNPVPYWDIFQPLWIVLLVFTAALSAYTGWQYLRPTKKS